MASIDTDSDAAFAKEVAERHALNQAQTAKARTIILTEAARKDPHIASLLKEHEAQGARVAELTSKNSELEEANAKLSEDLDAEKTRVADLEKQLAESSKRKK